jgi:hypothetical protein
MSDKSRSGRSSFTTRLMPRHSKSRQLLAGLGILALLCGGAFVSKTIRQGAEGTPVRERPGALSSTAGAVAEGDPQDRPRRVHDAGAAAEAKLRSLLEVREGEISCIRIPAHLMAGFPAGPLGDGLVGRPTGPDVVGIISRDAVLEGLKNLRSGSGSIEGSVDADAGEFEWSGGRLQITGTAMNATGSIVLKIEAREGGSTLECQTSLPPGGIVFLRSSHPDPEGILLVVGQRAAEEKPGPEKAEP